MSAQSEVPASFQRFQKNIWQCVFTKFVFKKTHINSSLKIQKIAYFLDFKLKVSVKKNARIIEGIFSTFLPSNVVYIWPQTPKKLNLPSNCAYTRGHFFALQFVTQLNFPQIAPIIKGIFSYLSDELKCVFWNTLNVHLLWSLTKATWTKQIIIEYRTMKSFFNLKNIYINRFFSEE